MSTGDTIYMIILGVMIPCCFVSTLLLSVPKKYMTKIHSAASKDLLLFYSIPAFFMVAWYIGRFNRGEASVWVWHTIIQTLQREGVHIAVYMAMVDLTVLLWFFWTIANLMIDRYSDWGWKWKVLAHVSNFVLGVILVQPNNFLVSWI